MRIGIRGSSRRCTRLPLPVPMTPRAPGTRPAGREFLNAGQPAIGDAEEDACVRRILTTLMRRAYRRPVTERDFESPLEFYRRGRSEDGFEAGVEMALSSILVSPEFLFRVERDPAGTPPNTAYEISDLELASRLSFFLWSSIPDDELLDDAIQGELEKT